MSAVVQPIAPETSPECFVQARIVGHRQKGIGELRKIAATLDFSAAEITFIADAPAELDAAKAVGLPTILVIREGSASLEG